MRVCEVTYEAGYTFLCVCPVRQLEKTQLTEEAVVSALVYDSMNPVPTTQQK